MKKVIIILCFFHTLNFAQQPNWIKNRPVSNRYFIGIGFADKNTKDYRAIAKAEALNDLASEISVTISSELIDIMVEYSGFSEEYARSEIRMSTREELDGYERVDDYNGKDFYWMYYRMSYKYFEGYAKNAISLYDDYLYSDKNDLVGRLQLLIPSLEYIYKAVRQDVYHESDGKRTNLRVEVPRLIKTIVNNIDISSPKIGYEAYYGRGIDEPIEVSLRNRINNKPIAFTNMEVFFERGDGKILNENPQTDGKGKINPRITQINSKLEEQVVKIAIKLTEFKADINKSNYINNVLKGMARNRALSIGIKVSEFRKDKVGVLVVGEGISPMLLSSLMSKFNYE